MIIIIMTLKVYNSEKFERGKWRYVLLSLVIILVLWLCVYYKNWTWFILIAIVLWWYIYLWLLNLKETTLRVTEEWLIMWGSIIPWNNLKWYVIEIDKKTQAIKNIVLLWDKNHSIHTISDTIDNIKWFLTQLDKYLPMVWDYNQTAWEKLARVLKL